MEFPEIIDIRTNPSLAIKIIIVSERGEILTKTHSIIGFNTITGDAKCQAYNAKGQPVDGHYYNIRFTNFTIRLK